MSFVKYTGQFCSIEYSELRKIDSKEPEVNGKSEYLIKSSGNSSRRHMGSWSKGKVREVDNLQMRKR